MMLDVFVAHAGGPMEPGLIAAMLSFLLALILISNLILCIGPTSDTDRPVNSWKCFQWIVAVESNKSKPVNNKHASEKKKCSIYFGEIPYLI